jgi:NitT/TauT family transport system substrate-binding protein
VAQLAVALGPENGHVAYSSFAATNRFISENADVVSRFVQGFARALTWLVQSDAAQVGESIASFFPEVDRELITQAVARYKSQDTWPSHPALEPPEYEGLQEILMAAGLVQESQPYEKVVSPEFAQGV